VITAALIGGVVTAISAAAKIPSSLPGEKGGCIWQGGEWHTFCSSDCPPNEGYEIVYSTKGFNSCWIGRRLQCCKRNQGEKAQVWAGDWESTDGQTFNCKVEHKDFAGYVCKGALKCTNPTYGEQFEWSIGDWDWEAQLGPNGTIGTPGTKWRGLKDCTILTYRGNSGPYSSGDPEGEAFTGKIVWKKGIQRGETWYKV